MSHTNKELVFFRPKTYQVIRSKRVISAEILYQPRKHVISLFVYFLLFSNDLAWQWLDSVFSYVVWKADFNTSSHCYMLIVLYACHIVIFQEILSWDSRDFELTRREIERILLWIIFLLYSDILYLCVSFAHLSLNSQRYLLLQCYSQTKHRTHRIEVLSERALAISFVQTLERELHISLW
jgi:hypothetical protein